MLIQSHDVYLTAAVVGLCLCTLHVYKGDFADFFIVPPDTDVFRVLRVRYIMKISSSADIDYTQTLYFRCWWRLSKLIRGRKNKKGFSRGWA
jgi:hypothetical protein